MATPTNLLSLAETVDAPSDDENGTVADTDSDFYCETCGKPIPYSGRGRHPRFCDEHRRGSKTGTPSGKGRGAGSVETAVQTLGAAYDALGLTLTLTGALTAASQLADAVPTLTERNRQFLAHDPQLVKMLNRAGSAGGRFAFILTQVITLGPVVMTATNEYKERLSERAAKRDAEFAEMGN